MEPSNEIEIVLLCGLCDHHEKVVVPEAGYKAWLAGQVIQKALPNLTRSQAELLISGTCGKCFNKIVPND